jgi:hypothetical protein
MESQLLTILERIEKFFHLDDQKQHQHKEIMSALENLTAATQNLTASVDAAVTVLNTPHPTDAQVQSAADAVNAQTARLNSAVTPPAPAPTP